MIRSLVLSILLCPILASAQVVDRVIATNGEARTEAISSIVLHTTGAGTFNEAVERLAYRGDRRSHYVVGRDGTLVGLVPEVEIAPDGEDANATSIVVHVVNRGDGEEPFSGLQRDALTYLLTDVTLRNGLAAADVSFADLAGNFPIDSVRAAIVEASVAIGPTERAPAPAKWPDPRVELVQLSAEAPSDFAPRRVFIDAGHGSNGNAGNTGALCQKEQDFALSASTDLADYLRETKLFSVKVSRTGDETVSYSGRIKAADEWKADVMISLHSDVRGVLYTWQPKATMACTRSDAAPGFSVLRNDGDKDQTRDRKTLSHAIATSMIDAGFGVYDGIDYPDWMYSPDRSQAGVFINARPEAESPIILRKPSMPSVIVEAHHAMRPEDVRRWRQADTRDAFGAAMAVALIDYFTTAEDGVSE